MRTLGWVEGLQPVSGLAGRLGWHGLCAHTGLMPDTHQLTEAIEAYLANHPLAADSADGVARWWLTPHGMQASPADVEAALATLVRRGRLRCVTLADGNRLYSGAAEAGATPARRN